MITFLLIGDEIQRVPGIGQFLAFPKAAPTQEAITIARINAARQVSTEFFSLVDGGPDLLLPDFEASAVELCDTMNELGMDIGTAREMVRGVSGRFMHHGIVCRTSAFKALALPSSGCFAFETMAYRMLTARGAAISHKYAYDWIPSVGGAAKWHETPRARLNGHRWAMGLPPIPSGLDRKRVT